MYEVTVHSETHKPGHAVKFHQHTEFLIRMRMLSATPKVKLYGLKYGQCA